MGLIAQERFKVLAEGTEVDVFHFIIELILKKRVSVGILLNVLSIVVVV